MNALQVFLEQEASYWQRLYRAAVERLTEVHRVVTGGSVICDVDTLDWPPPEPPVGTVFLLDGEVIWRRHQDGWRCSAAGCTHCPCGWSEARGWRPQDWNRTVRELPGQPVARPAVLLALPPGTGEGYDPDGPALWRAGHQVTYSDLGRTYRRAVANDRDTLTQLHVEADLRAAEVLGDRYHPHTPVTTRVEPGQTWVSTCTWLAPRTVTAVAGALVDTDMGRTTVFALNRHWRLADSAAAVTSGADQ